MSQPKWDYVCSEYVYNFDPPGSGRVWWGRIGAKWYWLHVEPWNATPDATQLILAHNMTAEGSSDAEHSPSSLRRVR